VGLGSFLHLCHGAVDVLIIQMLLEPIILIPTDEEPYIFWTVETLKTKEKFTF
jgi:hypothetical protein